MAEPLAIGSNYDDLIRFLRERASNLGMTDKIIEEIGGFTGGHVGKLLGAARTKSLGPTSFGLMLGALGLKFAIVEDAEATARIRQRYEPSTKSKRELTTVSLTVTPDLATQVFTNHLAKISRLGVAARMEKLTPLQRSRIARKAGRASGRARRSKPSMGTF